MEGWNIKHRRQNSDVYVTNWINVLKGSPLYEVYHSWGMYWAHLLLLKTRKSCGGRVAEFGNADCKQGSRRCCICEGWDGWN